MSINTATKLAFITKRSKRETQGKITSLAYLLNAEYLFECYRELKKGKAAGIDNRRLESYTDEEMKQEITETVSKMKAKKYKPKPARRVLIEKLNGKLRPLGIPTVIDKVVQQGIKKILEAMYEPHFMDMSYGFRPNKNCHQALKAVHKMVMTKPINWIIDVDIKGFFDNVDHHWMIECLDQKISDPNFRSIIIKFLKAGVVEEGKYSKTEKGTPQGGILSPVLANIYLHYILDLWFEKVEKKRIKGYTEIIRYADDFIIGAQTKSEAYQILEDLKERLKKFKLEVSIEKTGIKEFGKYARQNSKNRGSVSERKPNTFDFLGLTHYCSKSRKGNFLMKVKTNKQRMKNKTKEMSQWLKAIRNRAKIKDIWKTLSAKLRGHYNYYGVSSNSRGTQAFYYRTIILTYKWMNRRSQKQSFSWQTFTEYLKLYPLPKPALVFNMYDIW
jgi:group II intron reverse transcriptase/maturase